jgi:hypothetical protein
MAQGKLTISSSVQKKHPLCIPVERWRYIKEMLENIKVSHPGSLILGGIIGGFWIASILGTLTTGWISNGNNFPTIPFFPDHMTVFYIWLCDLVATTLALLIFYVFYMENKRKTLLIKELLQEMQKLEEKGST